MPSLLCSPRRLAILCCLLAVPTIVTGQNAFSPGGPDYAVAGALPGDQTFPNAAINASGGWLVWQDNAVDGDGLGIRAQRLNGGLVKLGDAFRVNVQGAGAQERPQVALLNSGGAVFVWQGGKVGFQKIYARFLAAGGSFLTGDILVNTYTNEFQIDPAVATLADGSVVVVWASYGQDGSMQGIYGQKFSASGSKIGAEFQVNSFTLNNQRSPALATLAGGNFVVTWVSELQRDSASVDIYARIFNPSGTPVGGAFAVNTSTTNICANPSVAGSTDGGFAVAWSHNNNQSLNVSGTEIRVTSTVPHPDSWDVLGRLFNASGAALTQPIRLNTMAPGDQYAPKISAFGKNYLAVWISFAQDGQWEGIFGQFITSVGALAGVEFQINTTAISRQITPSICTDAANRFLVLWSSFGAGTSFDLVARAYDLIHVEMVASAQSVTVSWNTQPGCVYQVQTSANNVTWANYGAPRTAAGYTDSITVTASGTGAIYRVMRIQ